MDGEPRGPSRTDMLVYHAIETNTTTDTLRSNVSDFALDVIRPFVQSSLDSDDVVLCSPSEFSLELYTTDKTLHGTISHPQAGSIRISVAPSKRDAPARLNASIMEILEKIESGDADPGIIGRISEVAICVAWAWLDARNHSS